MRFLSTLLLLISLPLTFSEGNAGRAPDNLPLPDDFDHVNRTPPQTLVLHRWPVSAGTDTKAQVPLGMIRFAAGTLTANFNPMTGGPPVKKNELYRVGVLKGGKWVGSVKNGKMLQTNVAATLTLHVDEQGEVFHVEYDAVALAKGAEIPQPEIVVVRPFPAAEPSLNKPVVLQADGRLPPKEEEKTFLQKYWYFILAGVILLAAAPGEGK